MEWRREKNEDCWGFEVRVICELRAINAATAYEFEAAE